MSKTRSEAERLLNTIVSSRVRLSSLRGEPASTVEPTMADDPSPTEGARREALDTAPEPATAPVEQDPADLFADLPVNDEQTDFEPPPLVLGLDTQPDTDELFDERDTVDSQTVDMSLDLDSPEDDPFSFIDLIPPDAPIEERVEALKVNSDPPPVRTKPLMPLPTGLAAGAPRAPDTKRAPTQTPAAVLAEPAAAVPAEPEAAVPAEPEAALAQPRRVEPRILDPERTRLEVDVFVEEDEPTTPEHWDVDVPQLTETSTPAAVAPTAQARLDDTAIFDIMTDAETALSRGDMSGAVSRFSDVLDWQPTLLEARLSRGRCLRDTGDSAGAMSDFLKCAEQAPHSPEPHVEIANLFFAWKDYGRAVVHYTDALALDPTHAMAMCRRGICHHQRRHAAKALEDLQSAKLLDSSIPNIDRYIQMVSSNNGKRPRR